MTNPYELRAYAEVEQRRRRLKGFVGVGSDAQEWINEEPAPDDEPGPARDDPTAVQPGERHDPTELSAKDESRAFLFDDDGDPIYDDGDPTYRQLGELSLWEKPIEHEGITYDVAGPKPTYVYVGDSKVITLEEWRKGRNPSPPQWCAVWAMDKGCEYPLPLMWPEPRCEYPYYPRVWWRDDRPAYCHCNGCMTHPKGYGTKYCCPSHEAEIDNARDREQRRREGRPARRRERSPLAAVADHIVQYKSDMRTRRRETKAELERFRTCNSDNRYNWTGAPFRSGENAR